MDQQNRPADPPHYSGSVSGGQPDLGWEDEAEYVNTRPGGFRLIRSILAVVLLIVIGVVAYTTVRNWFSGQLDPEGEPGAFVVVDVPDGATTSDIGSILYKKDVVPNPTFFRYFAQWKDKGNFQAGNYTFQENMSAEEAIGVLEVGPKQIEQGEFGVREGLWISEMVPAIAEQVDGVSAEDLQAAIDSGKVQPRYRPDGIDSWEGLLFPATYFIEEGISPLEIIAKMANEFARVTGELGYGGAEQVHGMSAYEVIIVASMVEAEAKTDADRPKIAQVIYNRLAAGEPTGIDATYLYALGDRQAGLTSSILGAEGPYNSRNQAGLPPTPIAAPGRASLDAAMRPAEGPWKYYVLADAEGNHAFFEEYNDFLTQKEISRQAGLLDQ